MYPKKIGDWSYMQSILKKTAVKVAYGGGLPARVTSRCTQKTGIQFTCQANIIEKEAILDWLTRCDSLKYCIFES